jgi:quinol monooxygenase YgiN
VTVVDGRDATSHDDAVVLVAVFQARPETADELRQRLIEMVRYTRVEPGCLRYDLHQDHDDPCRFAFIETWASPAALAIHDQTDHVRSIYADLPRLTAGPLEILRLRLVEPERLPGV